ncbi:hypothetical protein DXA36_04585 [Eisenbergiella sp. OF01-20]|nr:hypothetical protein DXA36_04585 [Eisenbergiella sp. OF01-20]
MKLAGGSRNKALPVFFQYTIAAGKGWNEIFSCGLFACLVVRGFCVSMTSYSPLVYGYLFRQTKSSCKQQRLCLSQ